MLKLWKNIDNGLDKLIVASGIFATGLTILLAILVFGLTMSRYVFRVNIPGLFDGATYLLIVFPFLTVAYTMREKRHVVIDFLTSRLPERTGAILSIAVYSVSLVYVVALGWQSWLWAVFLFKYKAFTGGAFPIPKGALSLVIVFGSFLLTVQVIRFLVYTIRSLPKQTAPPRLRDSPWLWVPLFITASVVSTALFYYGNTGAGVALLALTMLFSGMPVFLALGVIGVLGIYLFIGSASLMQMPIQVYTALNSFPLTCLPLFILGGLIMEGSGIAEDMFRFFELWTGRSRISPLIVTIIVGMVFCAISGSTTATTAVVAGVALPILMRRGFNKALSCGTIAGATVGSLIPPSIGYVVFAVLTDESIAALFMATMIPALILFAFYYLYVFILAKVSPKSVYEEGQTPVTTVTPVTWKERWSSLKTGVWGLLTPVIILGGIYFGIYTPTEAAGVLVVYAIIVAVFIKRCKLSYLVTSTFRSALTSSMILCIILSAFIFALLISQIKLADALVAWAGAVGLTSLGVIVLLFILLTVLGFFLEAASIKVITLPIFFPLAMAVGINNLWLGVFYQFNSEIGLLTPPVGLNAFIIKGVAGKDVPLATVFKGCTPFVLMMVLVLVIIYFFPQLVTWLPGTMRMK